MKKRQLFLPILLFFTTLQVSSLDYQFLSFIDYYGGIEPADGYENLRNRAFMRSKVFGAGEGGLVEWEISANFWVQPVGDPEMIDPWDIPGEAFLLFQSDNFDLTLGQKLVSYGFSDVYGPLNVLHSTNRIPLSVDDPFDSRRPDPLLQIRYFPNFDSSMELTYVPVTRPDREQGDSVVLTGSGDVVQWRDDPFISENPHSLFINYIRYGDRVDLQFFYGWYTEQTPDFVIPAADSSLSTLIEPVYHKKQTIGAAYAAGVGSATLSQDLALNLTENLDGKDLGAQYSDMTLNSQLLVNLPGEILSQFSLVYSYLFNYDQYETDPDPAAADYLAGEVQNFHNQPVEHIVFLVGHFEKSFLRDKLKSQLNVGFFFSTDILLTPRLGYALSDYWSLDAGADITLGDPPDHDLRRNPGNDNYYLRVLFQY